MANKKHRFNIRDYAAAYWENSPKWRRISMAVSFIAFFYALPFLNNPLINTPGSDFQSVLFYPVGMYVLMAIYVSAKVVLEDKMVNFTNVLITFPLLHISYGLGYLNGIFEFIFLNKKPSDKQKRMSR
jgi:hypothetical protein